MKYATKLPVVLAFALILGCAGGDYTDGVYEASGRGYHGDVVVQVTVRREKIEAIEIVASEETSAMQAAVVEALIPDIIEAQSLEGVDTISGATRTSEAVLQAVESALEEAQPQT
jgi:uncharacterized protein with FMN-binding domain